MDIQPKRREKRKKTQTFYPSPQSFSEADQYEYSSEDEDDDSSYDGDFKKTLVSSLYVPECHTRGMLEEWSSAPLFSFFRMTSSECERNTCWSVLSCEKLFLFLLLPPCRDYFYFSFSISSRLWWFFCCRVSLVEEYMNKAASDSDRACRIIIVRLHVKVKVWKENERWIHPKCM